MELVRPRPLALALAALTLASALAGCAFPGPRTVSFEVEPDEALAGLPECPPEVRGGLPPEATLAPPVGAWATWTADARRLLPPPPPTDGDGIELDELLDLQAERTPEQEARALDVQAQPAGEAWTERYIRLAYAHTDDGKGAPPRQAYQMAVLHTVMWDALVVALRSQDCYARPPPAAESAQLRPLFEHATRGAYPSEHAAVAGAAATVLESFFPNQGARFWSDAREVGQTRLVAGVARASDVDAGLELGRRLALDALAQRREDGHEAPAVAPERPDGACVWQESLPAYEPPMEPRWGDVEPFALGHGPERPRARPPPPCGSDEWLAQSRDLYDASHNVTSEQREAAFRWAGSPPLQWLEIGLNATRDAGQDTPGQLRTLAHLGVALADAGIAAWEAKFDHWTERPIHTIRRHWDANWTPIVDTPPFPGYVSGHSTFSGAASVVLAHFLPDQAASFRAQADEATMSRFWGGIHIMADNEEGLRLGREVGAAALRAAGG